MLLTDQNVVFHTVPAPAPVLVGPAEAERQVDVRRLEELVDRLLQQAFAGEPEIVEAEAADTIKLRQRGLLAHDVDKTQIIEAQFARQVRLIMPEELRHGPADVRPFGEARAPPFIVLGDRVELRQVEGDRA